MILCLLLFLDRHCCSVDINQLVDFFYVSIEMRAGWNGRFSRGSPHEGRGHRAGVERVCRFVKSWSSLLRVDVVSTRWWHRIYFFLSLSLSLSLAGIRNVALREVMSERGCWLQLSGFHECGLPFSSRSKSARFSTATATGIVTCSTNTHIVSERRKAF